MKTLFRSSAEAAAAARAAGAIGLYGSGQICGPEFVGDGWYYHTAHGAWGGEPRGEIIVSEGALSDEQAENLLEWANGWAARPVWLAEQNYTLSY